MIKKKLLLALVSVLATLCFTCCSDDDDFPTVGTLKVELTSWNAYYENNAHMAIFPIGYKENAIQIVDFGASSEKEVELNPGNYTVEVTVEGKEEHHWSGNTQVQAGRTVVLRLGDK